MSKSAFVRARVEPNLKDMAEHILGELGISPTQAITMLYKHVAREKQWPFELKIPNAETQQAMNDARDGVGVVTCRDIDDLFDQLDG